MKSKLVLALFLGLCLTAFSQDKFAKKYAAVITPELAKKHLSILASDEFEGRETGRPGGEKAAQYLKSEFIKLGLKGPVNGDYFQKLELTEKTILARTVSVNGKALSARDFPAASFIGPKTTFTNFVFVGYGIESPKYDDLSSANLEGKVVVVLPGEPRANGIYLASGTTAPSDWTAGPRNTKKLTAILAKKPALIINVATPAQVAASALLQGAAERKQLIFGKEVTTGNSLTLSADAVNQLLAGTGKKVDDIKISILETGKFTPITFTSSLEVDIQARYTPLDAKNVLGFMEGSDARLKNEVIVISAHYDHVGLVTTAGAVDKVNNGADDDGSGTTGVLEIATAFAKAKKEKHGPRRSILFLAVTGEEKGLKGSEYYSDHPVFPLANTVANLNIDMIGRVGYEYIGKADSSNYIYVIGSAMLSTTLRKISENANNTYMKMVADYKYDAPEEMLPGANRFYYRSDHYNFAKHNIPIIFYFNGVHDDYHKPSDEVSKINFPLLAKRAQLVFYTGWDLANRAMRPAVDVTTVLPPK